MLSNFLRKTYLGKEIGERLLRYKKGGNLFHSIERKRRKGLWFLLSLVIVRII